MDLYSSPKDNPMFREKKNMKVIIAGSRGVPLDEAEALVRLVLATSMSEVDGIEYVTGCCPTGPDQIPLRWENDVVHKFPADWNKHGRGAGYIRNRMMGDFADALIAIWDGQSSGTKNMISVMLEKNKPVFVYTWLMDENK